MKANSFIYTCIQLKSSQHLTNFFGKLFRLTIAKVCIGELSALYSKVPRVNPPAVGDCIPCKMECTKPRMKLMG